MAKTTSEKDDAHKKLVEGLMNKIEVNELRSRDAVARMGMMEAELQILKIRKEIAKMEEQK